MNRKNRKKVDRIEDELESMYQFGTSVNTAAEVSREYYEKTGNPLFKISVYFLIASLIAFGLGVMMKLGDSVNKSSTLAVKIGT